MGEGYIQDTRAWVDVWYTAQLYATQLLFIPCLISIRSSLMKLIEIYSNELFYLKNMSYNKRSVENKMYGS